MPRYHRMLAVRHRVTDTRSTTGLAVKYSKTHAQKARGHVLAITHAQNTSDLTAHCTNAATWDTDYCTCIHHSSTHARA